MNDDNAPAAHETAHDADTKHHSRASLNWLSLAALIFALIAAASFFVTGTAVLAVFAVGAGHVALQQISRTPQRGRVLAVIGLAVGYAIGIYGLFLTIQAWIAFGLQLQAL
ncbi:MAG: DUF4190 domain-containing protein [Salinibacterium sp.]|nr:DUF4190 domain-containing protein [Salinibacterium sp.]MBF0671454.1 DUF4190 domain-containing protein [Salinibacterium sp.]